VVFVHRLPQSRSHYVRINLRSGNVCVPEHHLYTAQIRPPFQKVGGETMADYVGRHVVEITCFFGAASSKYPERLPGETTAARRHE
jgi:hypothetical protein